MRQVAIITRTKNRTFLLKRCVESVLAQSLSDWIHVIVNDGGDSLVVDALLSNYTQLYRDRVVVIHNPVSVGMEAASNIGVRASESNYVVILDDDDSWEPSYLETMVSALSNSSNAKGVVCYTDIIFEKIKNQKVTFIKKKPFLYNITAIDLLELCFWNRFVPVSFLFDRTVFEKIGYFDESLPVCGDWEFNIRFLSEYEIDIVPHNLAYWHQRVHSKGAHGNSIFIAKHLHDKYRTQLINRWLRESLRNGTLDRGSIFAISVSAVFVYKLRAIRNWFRFLL